jgi:hypothetical protein
MGIVKKTGLQVSGRMVAVTALACRAADAPDPVRTSTVGALSALLCDGRQARGGGRSKDRRLLTPLRAFAAEPGVRQMLFFAHGVLHAYAISMAKAAYMIEIKRLSVLFGVLHGSTKHPINPFPGAIFPAAC